MATRTLEKPAPSAASVERTSARNTYLPPVDIYETKEELVLVADLPGVKNDQIEIQFEQGELTITGKVEDRQPAETNFLLRDYGTGDFVRSFHISESIDSGRITAEARDGVLTLHLPKVEAAKPRKTAVKG